MALTAGAINNLVRVFLGEPSNSGRWSDADLYTLINEAQKYISLQIEWPVVNLTTTSVANAQEYTYPEIITIERVYLAGQPCVPTDIATLEGTQIEYYDQSSNTTAYTPQWNSAVYATYPNVNTQMGYPNGVAPYYIGQRPQYYLNGGNLGFVPIPSGAYPISVWGFGVPHTLAQSTDASDFPTFFESSIAHKTAELCYLSDKDAQSAQLQALKFAEWMPKLRAWKLNLVKNKSRGPRVISYRHFFGRDSILSGDD